MVLSVLGKNGKSSSTAGPRLSYCYLKQSEGNIMNKYTTVANKIYFAKHHPFFKRLTVLLSVRGLHP
jgi:hypothetical protein